MEFGFSVHAVLSPTKKKLPDLNNTARKAGGGKNDAEKDSDGAKFIDLSGKTLRLLDRSQQEKASRVVDKLGEHSAKVFNFTNFHTLKNSKGISENKSIVNKIVLIGLIGFRCAFSHTLYSPLCMRICLQAQKLGAVITTFSKYLTSDQRGFYKIKGTKALGFIKVGRKKLFIRVWPLCVCIHITHLSG